MNKGLRFERDGKYYEVVQEGIEYVQKNKRDCIRRQVDSKSMSIPNAIQEKLICETSPPKKEGLFSQIPKHIAVLYRLWNF